MRDEEITVRPIVHNGEALPSFAESVDWIRRLCSTLQIPAQLIGISNGNIHSPMGPVVDSTLAEKDEE